MFEFKLPDLGEGIHEAEILKWHIQPGDLLKEDAPVADVETDKAVVTIPSPVAGRVVSLAGNPGSILHVGQTLLTIDPGAGQAGVPPVSPTGTGTVSATANPVSSTAKPVRPSRAVPAAPATRRLARELGIDLGAVPPTGPGGRVTPDDIRNFASRPPPEVLPQGSFAVPTTGPGDLSVPGPEAFETGPDPARPMVPGPVPPAGIPFLDLEPLPDFSQWGAVTREPLRSIRRKVAHKMVTSMVLIPHVAHLDEADVTLLEDLRKRENEARQGPDAIHLTLLPFVIKAVTAGLRESRIFNASLDPFKEEIVYKDFYNIGVAVDTGTGLVVPVIKNTERLSILQIATAIHDLAAKARSGKLSPPELRGGTFTITNIGPLGGTGLIPAINYPEAAILGMGRVQEKPVVRDGAIVIRRILPLTLAFDHRIADGADAARLVTRIVRHLSDPNCLLLET